MLNSSIETILREIDAAIKACDSIHTPTLCSMRGNDKQALANEIYKLVAGKSLSISEAMAELERIYNINSIE